MTDECCIEHILKGSGRSLNVILFLNLPGRTVKKPWKLSVKKSAETETEDHPNANSEHFL
jgi:hypothetical protein